MNGGPGRVGWGGVGWGGEGGREVRRVRGAGTGMGGRGGEIEVSVLIRLSWLPLLLLPTLSVARRT